MDVRYRLLALDIDGTVLGPDGVLRPRTAEAIARAARAGVRPVLCTGRRYRRARAIADLLRLDSPLVCNSGAIVKDPATHRTLWRADFDDALADEALALFHAHGQPVVVFTDRAPESPDFIASAYPSGRAAFDDYVGKNHEHAEIDSLDHLRRAADGGASLRDFDRQNGEAMFHLCAVGMRDEMLSFERMVHDRLPGRVRTFVLRTSRYLGTMCEILRADAGKWTALLHLAESWGVGPSEICAVGDDANDVPMLQNAGLGVAMGHAHRDVRAIAHRVTGRHDEDGVAMVVDAILSGDGSWNGVEAASNGRA